MPRFRRYRVFLIFAAILTFTLYNFWQTQPEDESSRASFGGSRSSNVKPEKGNDRNSSSGKEPVRPAVDIQGLAHSADPLRADVVESSSTKQLLAEHTQATENVVDAASNTAEAFLSIQTAPPAPAAITPDERLAAKPEEKNEIHWEKQTEHYPVAPESLIHLPTGTPKEMPQIQYKFPNEAAEAKTKREERRDKVKSEFLHAWNGYKEHAWSHDEVRPVSGGSSDPFCGWSATMVDALDTLWIMGLKDEFEEALVAVEKIDFTTTPKSTIPVFETTIRYLGGLLAAYDISGAKYPVLLNKATELGEILMSIFDTPNRMPVLHYSWQPSFASGPHRASSNSNFAELGSLSLEFTRLAQLTGENKYYDAISRITDALVEWQKRGTALKGVFPDNVDASGCNATVPSMVQPPIQERHINGNPESKSIVPERSASSDTKTIPPMLNSKRKQFPKRTFSDNEICAPQGLTSQPHQSFSMGGGQDSTYEYFSKMWLLLGGLDTAYRTLYLDTMSAIKTYMLYRPLIPGGRNILFSAKVLVNTNLPEGTDHEMTYEVTHLTCFLGGMVGMGSKLFGLDDDLSIAERLTDGCVWAYEATRSGIMPEDARAVPCDNPLNCPWDEEQYYKYLDPRWASRDKEVEAYDAEKAREEMERTEKEAQAKLEEEERQKAAQVKLDAETQRTQLNNDAIVADPPINDTTSYNLNGSAVESEHDIEIGSLAKANHDTKPNVNADRRRTASSNITASIAPELEQNLAKRDSLLPPPADQSASSASPAATQTRFNPDASTGDDLPILPVVRPTKTTINGVPQNPTERSLGSVDGTQQADPYRPLTHKEYIAAMLAADDIPPGFARIGSDRYILRPEAIESVFYMHRITGAKQWAEKGWKMFEAIIQATRTEIGHSAVSGLNQEGKLHMQDSMESFWLAETLKYFYLLYSEPELVSLDDWVLNTEAHPFKRPS